MIIIKLMTYELSTIKLQNFVKWCLIEFATNGELDFRSNNCKDKGSSPLRIFSELHNSIDEGIIELCNTIYSNEDFKGMINDLSALQCLISEPINNGDDIYELEHEIFVTFITLAGLNTIENLHSDDYDMFKDEFFKILSN